MRYVCFSASVGAVSRCLGFFFLSMLLLLAPSAGAQDAAPDYPPAGPPAVFQDRIPAGQLSFLSGFSGQTTKEAMKDKRFRVLIKAVTPRTEYHYGRDMSLTDTIETMLDGGPLPVDVRDSRYVTVTSRGGPYLRGRGFLWFDMQEGIGLGGVFFSPTNGEPAPTLAIFSRQLRQDALGLSQLPLAFQEDLNQWSAVSGVPPIPVLYFIPNNGKKYPLVHDEDYCVRADGAPEPVKAECLQMDADASEVDMNAAYFMNEVHNAANGTAWMLEPDQIAWIGVRDRTCGVTLACRIHITRVRTRVILRH
jgi:hypothetical protein